MAPALDEIVTSINGRRERLARAMDLALAADERSLEQVDTSLARGMATLLDRERVRLEGLAKRRCLTNPESLIDDRAVALMHSD